jgi:hypothetical protein
MKTLQMIIMTTAATALLAGTALALTPFESGSSCGSAPVDSNPCSGAYTAPSVNSTIALPANGILDYTTFTVPAGYTVSFLKNAANTPVLIRTSGNVTIAGNINVGAQISATNSGTAGDGNVGDDGQAGTGGPGGFDGGRGGLSLVFGGVAQQRGGAGKGPGGGYGGGAPVPDSWGGALSGSAGGGGFGSIGGTSGYNVGGTGGAAYGQSSILPLIGGSGGGGGGAGSSFNGAGGGGGGGAITIASSDTIIFSGGNIYANGGGGGNSSGTGNGGSGGGGSGGAIRLVANTLTRSNGYCYAQGAVGGVGSSLGSGGSGGDGRIRLEYNTSNGTSPWTSTTPQYTWALPGHVFVPNNPTLTIVSVTPTAGLDSGITKTITTNTGNADITFQTGTTTATVNLLATNIPAGSVADVHVIPTLAAARTKVLSTAFSGGLTATATVTLSPGNNVLLAAVTYTVTEVVAMNLPTFDNGERVAKIRVEGGMDGKSQVIYITASGKEYPAKAKA